MSVEWIKRLKIAVIEEDIQALDALRQERPVFSNLNHAREAKALVDQAIELLKNKRMSLMGDMGQLKKGRDYYRNLAGSKTVFSAAV